VQNPWRRAGITSGVAGRIAILSVVAGVLVAAIVVPLTGLIGVATRDAAKTFNNLSVQQLGVVPTRSEILDSQGHLIAYYYPNNIYRVPVKYGYIAPVMRNAIVAIEDYRYYQHGAMDPRGTLRAIANDLSHNPVQGGSTLAQQYVKNALILTAHTKSEQAAAAADTSERKIRELRIAANVEKELTKDQLLAAYLNVAYFENSAYGIEVAAERYFSTTAKHLTLGESAMLAGMVENPVADDPIGEAKTALARRNTVLFRMAQLHYISKAAATAAAKKGLGLHLSKIPQHGCQSFSAHHEPFFCDYVLAVLRTDKAYKKVQHDLDTTGGLRIYTTMSPQDEHAAQTAVDYVEPNSGLDNPGHNADAEVLITPGSGRIRAIAENRRYGTGPGETQTNIDYAVDTPYDGSTSGVQTGSSSKLFTLITALEQGVPFGYSQAVSSPANIAPYYSCHGGEASFQDLNDAEGPGKGIFTLYNGTTESINVFYALLEQKVGLCSVVKTAARLGLTRVDGTSLLKPDYKRGLRVRKGDPRPPEDDNASFTLGEAPVSPMGMATAYATVAARGIRCKPVAIEKIVAQGGRHLPVESADCHRVIPAAVADAATHILQGVLASPGTAANRGIGREAAAKTGTANDGTYAAFAGYTPSLVGYVSVFNPDDPIGSGKMLGANSCYREVDGAEDCPDQMFGDNAPGATWQMTFLHAALGAATDFVPVPSDSPYYSEGTGVSSPKPPKKTKPTGGKGGGTGGTGGGNGGGPTQK
jgi:membrane peptidoglycan carboxypeptidase